MSEVETRVKLMRDYAAVANYDLYKFAQNHTVDDLIECLHFDSTPFKKAYTKQAVDILTSKEDSSPRIAKRYLRVETNFFTSKHRRTALLSVDMCGHPIVSFVRLGREGVFVVAWYNPISRMLVAREWSKAERDMQLTEDLIEEKKELLAEFHDSVCSPYIDYFNWREVRAITEIITGTPTCEIPSKDEYVTEEEFSALKHNVMLSSVLDKSWSLE